MSAEAENETGVEITVGPNSGACGTPGITIEGSTDAEGLKLKVEGSDPLALKEKYCARLKRNIPSCPLCTASTEYLSQIQMFCPFQE